MQSLRKNVLMWRVWSAIGIGVVLSVFFCVHMARAASVEPQTTTGERLITIYDQGEKRVVLTHAATLGETLQQAHVNLAQYDRIEPSLDTRYTAESYTVNIYRAHPVTIIDGMKRQQVLSPYRTAADIAKDAGVSVRSEDNLELSHSTDVLADGMGARLEITRALPVQLVLYGAESTLYTQAKTVKELLKEKGVTLGSEDTVSTPLDAGLTENMKVEVWRNGAQTLTREEDIDFTVRQILDIDLPVGESKIQTPGTKGKKKVSYKIVRREGQEMSRTKLQELVVEEPKEQVEIVGNKPLNPLTPGKGAHVFIDSKGVSHRETYYDLPMNVTMGSCGGGDYTVRTDGAKVDKDGYILVAANLGNYPRCSIVETSMGLGKVYDTGGFAVRHPHGFDLATDWSNKDGR